MKTLSIVLFFILALSCNQTNKKVYPVKENTNIDSVITETSLIILGNVQDGGSPHIGCKKDCCKYLFTHPDPERKVVSLGIIDPENKKSFIFEATPDFPAQLKNLQQHCPFSTKETPDGIFLTHAHIGHYTGLMYLGKEAMNSKNISVYAMPRMKIFLEQNGPWSQLVKINNIDLQPLENNKPVILTPHLTVTPFKVPHRDEYSETVGYIIEGPNKKVLFIPDIDKWEKWDTDIIATIAKVDYAFIDGTFYDGEEISNRNISEIPHPFIIESMNKFKSLSPAEKNKIYFIHFNHTNPALIADSKQSKIILENGFNIARRNLVIKL
jgi:pyrroloquinoline quinone biosynthesis protein B